MKTKLALLMLAFAVLAAPTVAADTGAGVDAQDCQVGLEPRLGVDCTFGLTRCWVWVDASTVPPGVDRGCVF